MKALLLTAPSRFELVDWETPPIAADEVLIRVGCCGICGSDVHGFDGSTGRRIPPLVMGHEAAGEVAAVGSAVARLRVGDRVTFDSTIFCGQCAYCRQGAVNLCEHRQVLGVSCGEYRRHGAFAEYVAAPERVCYVLPEGVSYEAAAMVEPAAVAVHAVDLARPSSEDAAVVVGTGMIGLLVIQALRAAGVPQVAAVDVDAQRLAIAQQCGATEIFVAGPEAAAQVVAATRGGATIALECVGATAPIRTAIDALRKGGRLVLVGNVSPTVEMPLQAIVTRQLTLLGSCASAGEYPRCLEMMASGAIDVTPLISACVPLSEGAAWFDRLARRESGLLKVLLRP
jgi:L-iditol 2-dehydrogenase